MQANGFKNLTRLAVDRDFGPIIWTQTLDLGLQASDFGLRTQACQ